MFSHPALQHCRRVFLRDYAVDMHLGVFPAEKKRLQRVLINLEVFVPAIPVTQDSLDAVWDYAILHRSVSEYFAEIAKNGVKFSLQETLCEALSARLLADPAVVAVGVSTEKTQVYENCRSVGVEIFRMKVPG